MKSAASAQGQKRPEVAGPYCVMDPSFQEAGADKLIGSAV